jgi:hypothetical protein
MVFITILALFRLHAVKLIKKNVENCVLLAWMLSYAVIPFDVEH